MKTLMEYAFFHAVRVFKEENLRNPVSQASGVVIVPVTLYVAGLVAALGNYKNINLVREVANIWPEICEQCKYFKPEHGLGLIIGIVAVVYVSWFFLRKNNCERILQRFSTSTEMEKKVGYWARSVFMLSGFIFAVSATFNQYVIMTIIILGLIYFEIKLRKRFPEVK